MSTITEDATIKRSDDLAVTEVEGETVILDVASGQYFGLNPVGTHVFDLLDSPRSVGELIDTIQAMYDAPPDRVRADLITFIDTMVDHKLIVRADAD